MNLYSGQTVNSTQRNQRSTRPKVPLFHSNSTGSLSNANTIQYQQVTDLTNFDMGGGGNFDASSLAQTSALTMFPEINVAYDGTFGDLSATGAGLFHVNRSFEYDQFIGAGDGFTAINGPTGGVTVSPKDVFNNDSVPPSTSFTNLTTPGSTFLETPDEDYQTSPLFADNLGVDNHGADDWYTLFPDDNTAPFMARTISASSTNQIMVHPGGEGNRKRSSIAMASPAPFSPPVKHSTTAGVNARKRDKPLPPIVVDENDTVALKRARNTAAARKSRAKKVHERDELETRIADLEAQVDHWKSLALELGATQEMSDD